MKRKTKQTPIPAATLLRAESARINILVHALPDKSRGFVEAMAWAYDLSAAFLESLGAPEKLVKYFPENKKPK